MKYLVTGASGLVGRALTLKLADDGHHVVAMYRSTLPVEFMEAENIELVKGDVTNADFLDRIMEGVDGVFHVAAFAKPWARDPKTYYSINEEGTRKVCEACIKHGVKRLVYTSSAGIHGAQHGSELIHEDTWPEEYHTDYERSKLNGMKVALSHSEKGLEVTIISPARVYSPGEVSESNVPVRMLHLFLKNKFGFVPASGEGVGSYVYIDDIVHGHMLAMTEGENGQEYLLGGENLSYLEFFEVLKTVTGKSYPVLKVPYSLSLAIGKTQLFLADKLGLKPTITTPWVRRYLQNWGVNSDKIKALGYQPISLKEGMQKVLGGWSQD